MSQLCVRSQLSTTIFTGKSQSLRKRKSEEPQFTIATSPMGTNEEGVVWFWRSTMVRPARTTAP